MSQDKCTESPTTKIGPGKLWDNLGSTKFSRGNVVKTNPLTTSAKRSDLFRKMIESSDDELDFLSSGSRSDDVEETHSSKSKRRAKKQTEKLIVPGRELIYHPDYLPKRKLPDFKKVTVVSEEEGPSTSRGNISDAARKPLKQTKSYEILATLHNNENERLPKLSSDEDSLGDPTQLSSRVSPHSKVRKFPGLALSPLRVDDPESPQPNTPQNGRKNVVSSKLFKPIRPRNTSSPSSDNNDCFFPTSQRASAIRYSDSGDHSETTPRAKLPESRSLERFPTLTPLSISNSIAHERNSFSGTERGDVPIETSANHVHSYTRDGTPSDKKTPRRNQRSRFPFPSPLSSPTYRLSPNSPSAVRGTKCLGMINAEADEDADDESPKQWPSLRPFPMTASHSKICNRTPHQKIDSSQQTYPENSKKSPLTSDLEEYADDSLLLGESVDPSTLCPFCDERLPPNPSPFYRSLLEAARAKAYPDPRPTNPYGLRALMGIYVASCKRHRFEAHQVPQAIAKGWPMNIDFRRVRGRVEKLGSGLGKLVRGEGNARDESIYWTTVIKEVHKLGSRAASGVKGQFESFEKTQPGYYGELGSMILHQTLYNMFPPSSFDAQSITPLTPQEFIQRILVPEAALSLIMEDTRQDQMQALQTMRESSGYGVAMFPDTSEGLGIGAGEDIVLERALARRRELDDEERMEALLSKDSNTELPDKNKGTKRPKKINSTTTTDIEEVTRVQRKIKRKKAGSRTDAENRSDGHVPRASRVMGARKSARVTSSSVATSSPLPLSSPSQAGRSPRSPGLDSSEHTPTRSSGMDTRALQSKPTYTLSDTYGNSKRGFPTATGAPNALPTTSDSHRRSEGRSVSAPIDVDDLQIINLTDSSSLSENQRPVLSKAPSHGLRSNWIVPTIQGSNDAEDREVNYDAPTPKPRPRRRLAERDASVDRRLGSNKPKSLIRDKGQERDSSVEIIEPPWSRDRLVWHETTENTTVDNNPDGVHARAQRTYVRASNPKYERHNWLMNDSSD